MLLTLSSKCTILTLLTLATGSCATTTSVWDFTNESADCNGVGASHRVRIPPFTLAFSPTTALTESQRDVIKESAEDVLLDFFSINVDQGVAVDFVDLIIKNNHALFRRRQLQDNSTAVLQVAGGIASFRGGEPALDEVNAWASQALEGKLLEMLQEESELTNVESIVFTSLTSPPSPSPSTSQVIDSIASLESTQSNPTHSFAFVASVVGGFAFVSLVILVALWMRGQRSGVKGVCDKSATAKGLTLVATDVAECSTLKAGGRCLVTDKAPNQMGTVQNFPSSESTIGSVSPSTSTVSTNATLVKQEPGDVWQGSGESAFLCAFEVIDNACVCHVSRNNKLYK